MRFRSLVSSTTRASSDGALGGSTASDSVCTFAWPFGPRVRSRSSSSSSAFRAFSSTLVIPHDTHEIAHERSDIAHHTDGSCVVHARRADDADVTDDVALHAIPADHQAKPVQSLHTVFGPDRDVNLVRT